MSHRSELEDPSTWRLRTPEGIPYRLISRSGSFEFDSATAEETYLVPADRLYDFARFAFPTIDTTAGYMRLSGGMGMPGLEALRARRVRWEPYVPGVPIDPFGADGGAPPGTYADVVKVIVEYAPRAGGASSDDTRVLWEVTANASASFIAHQVEGSKAKWQGARTEPVTEPTVPVGHLEPQIEWSVRMNYLPGSYYSNLATRLASLLGYVNSNTMVVFDGAPPETVLFLSYSASQQWTWRSSRVEDQPMQLEMRFLQKAFYRVVDGALTLVTHNHFYRPGHGYQRLLVNGQPVYPAADLNGLFV